MPPKFSAPILIFASLLSFAVVQAQEDGPVQHVPQSTPEFLQSWGYQDGDPTYDSIDQAIVPGVTHRFEFREDGPLTMNFVTVDPAREGIDIIVEPGQGKLGARETVLATAWRVDHEPENSDSRTIMALNADFWGPGDRVINLMITEGVIWRSPYRGPNNELRPVFTQDESGKFNITLPEFSTTIRDLESDDTHTITEINVPYHDMIAYTWVVEDDFDFPEYVEAGILTLDTPEFIPNKPVSGTFRMLEFGDGKVASELPANLEIAESEVLLVRDEPFPEWIEDGDRMELSATLAGHDAPVTMAVGGGPIIFSGGKIRSIEDVAKEKISDGFYTTRHPRTAVGIREDGKIIFSTVDGRQAGRSTGIALYDLGVAMQEKGCVVAMNLDGGGSTSMAINGQTVNFPSDIFGMRPVGNSILVRQEKRVPGEVTSMRISPRFQRVLPGAQVVYTITPLDEHGQVVEFKPDYKIQYLLPEGFEISETDPSSRNQVTVKAPGIREIKPYHLGKNLEFEIAVASREGTLAFENVNVQVTQVSEMGINDELMSMEQGKRIPFKPLFLDKDGKHITVLEDQFEKGLPDFTTYEYDPETGPAIFAHSTGTGKIGLKVGELVRIWDITVGNSKRKPIESFDAEPDQNSQLVSGVRYNSEKSRIIRDPHNFREGNGSWKLRYGMAGQESGIAKIAMTMDHEFPENAYGMGIMVYGYGDGHWLRSEWRDEYGQNHVLNLTGSNPGIDWNGEWRVIDIHFEDMQALGEHSEKSAGPYTLKSIYIVQTNDAKKSDGEIVFDDMNALTVE